MKLFLIRHGQTTSNNQRIYVGQTDVPLTETGREQALAIRPVLEQFAFDRVYSSDLSRAIDTQELALPFDDPIRTPLLREIDVGSAAGMAYGEPFANMPEEYRKNGDYSIFGGENKEMACRRLRKFLDLLEADSCENVAAFAHNGILNCMLRLVLEAPIKSVAAPSPNCAIHVFELNNGIWKLRAWNYMGKL